MNDSIVGTPGAPQPAPRTERAAHHHSATTNRLPRYISLMISWAALSTVSGYQVARTEISGANWLRNATLLPASAPSRVLVPASTPGALNPHLEPPRHLPPHPPAERLRHLAV